MVREVLRAAETADQEGVKVEVIDLMTISPMDDETFLESVRRTGRAVVVHEAPPTCGVGAEVIARINEKALFSLQGPVVRVTGFDTAVPLTKLENHYLPSPERILRGIRKVMTF
jgi:pyruvate dehydrogenase E1 component beta subunit